MDIVFGVPRPICVDLGLIHVRLSRITISVYYVTFFPVPFSFLKINLGVLINSPKET